MAVLDASALLALLKNEAGADIVLAALGEASISTVNLSEVLTKTEDLEGDASYVRAQVQHLRLNVVPFDTELAQLTADLRAPTRQFGLSLGDRACLATGLALRQPVLTAERIWAKLHLGVEVRLIR